MPARTRVLWQRDRGGNGKESNRGRDRRGVGGCSLQRAALLLLCLVHSFRDADGIRLEAVVVPQFKFRGDNATLLCKYELEPHEDLFSLKWYKEETEFYRYMPEARPNRYPHEYGRDAYGRQHPYDSTRGRRFRQNPTEPNPDTVRTWKVPGIKIDMKTSLPQKVELKRVSFKSTGMYRCEVTVALKGDSHKNYNGIAGFDMRESVKRLTVVELPSSRARPRITGGDPSRAYRPGDQLNLTCVSAPSNPPSQLEWRLNGRPVSSDYVLGQHLIDSHRGLYSSSIGLLLPLEERHFESGDGQIRVKCLGTIEAEFWESDSDTILQGEKLVRVLKVLESQWPASASMTHPHDVMQGAAICILILYYWTGFGT